MSARADVQGYALPARVELFILDGTVLGDATLHRFHSGKNQVGTSIVWQGETYAPMPIDATGFEWTGRGTMPRPTIQVANVSGLISVLCQDYDDLIGAKLTRKVVFSKYLDAVNFPGGVNADADPTAGFPDDVWYVFRKSSENKVVVEFELAAPFDVQGIRLPRRQVIANVCPWVYRSAECSYAGGPVAKVDDTATADPDLDACGKRIASCKLRFGAVAQLPYGGFPGAGRIA